MKCKICNRDTHDFDEDSMGKYHICYGCYRALTVDNTWGHLNRPHHPMLTKCFYQWQLLIDDARTLAIADIAAYANPETLIRYANSNGTHIAYRAWVDPCYLISVVDIYQSAIFFEHDKWEYLAWQVNPLGLSQDDVSQDAYYSSKDACLARAIEVLKEREAKR